MPVSLVARVGFGGSFAYRGGRTDRQTFVEGTMANLLRGCLAGWGASKLGGGCLSTILIFFLLYWLLGVVF